MTRKLFYGLMAVASVFAAANANADQDYYSNAPGYHWTGFYAGLSGGGFWENSSNSLTITNNNPNNYFFPPAIEGVENSGSTGLDSKKGFFGAQIGYNQQVCEWLWGVELDYKYINSSEDKGGTFLYTTNNAPYELTQSLKTDWLVTLRPRAGWTIDKALVYVTGGLAFAKVKYNQNFSETPFTPTPEAASFSETKVGWTLGLGGEYAFYDKWSVKVEYLYSHFNGESATGQLANANGNSPALGFVDGATFKNSLDHFNIQTLEVGINYLFS